EHPSVWPLILLLAGLAVLAGIFAAVFAFTGSSPSGLVHKVTQAAGGDGGGPVRVRGFSGYDPQGTGGEHDDMAGQATDGQGGTYWETETYSNSDFGNLKSGVGLVLDAGKSQKLSGLTIHSDTPGFAAVIKSGGSP